MKKLKQSDQIKVHVINVGYGVEGNTVTAHLVWCAVYPKEYQELSTQAYWQAFHGEKHHSIGVATLQPGDKFDLKKGQRIALAKAETAAYGELVKEVKDTINSSTRGFKQAQDFLAKASRVKTGNRKYIERVDRGDVK